MKKSRPYDAKKDGGHTHSVEGTPYRSVAHYKGACTTCGKLDGIKKTLDKAKK